MRERKEYARALNLLEKAKERTKERDAKRIAAALAELHYEWAETLESRAEFAEALSHYRSALTWHRVTSPTSACADLNGMATAYLALGQTKQARDTLRQAFAFPRTASNLREWGEIHSLNGEVLMELGALSEAWKQLELARILQKKAKDMTGEGETLCRIAAYHLTFVNYNYQRKDLDTARQACREAAYIAQKQNDQRLQVNVLLRSGDVANAEALLSGDTNNLDKAASLFQQAKTLAQSMENPLFEVQAVIGQAEVELNRIEIDSSHFGQIWSLCDRALPIATRIGYRKGRAILLVKQGYCDHGRKDYRAESKKFDQSLAIIRTLANPGLEARGRFDLGTAYYNLSDYGKALPMLERSLSLYLKIFSMRKPGGVIAEIYTGLGNTYLYIGHYQDALQNYRRGLGIAHGNDDPYTESSARNGLGRRYRYLGKYDAAITEYAIALAMTQKYEGMEQSRGITLGNLGEAYWLKKDYARAIKNFQNVIQIAEKLGDEEALQWAYLNWGNVNYDQGHFTEASGKYREGLLITQRTETKRATAFAYFGLMQAHKAQGNIPLSIFYGKRAVNSYQEIRQDTSSLDKYMQKALVAANSDHYEYVIALLATTGRINEALPILDRARQREYLNFIADPDERERIRRATAIPVPLTAREARWNREVSTGLTNWATLAREADLLERLQQPTLQEKQRAQTIRREADAALVSYQKVEQDMNADFSNASKKPTDEDKITDSNIPELVALRKTLKTLGPGHAAFYSVVTPDGVYTLLVTPGKILPGKSTREIATRSAASSKKSEDFLAQVKAFSLLLQLPKKDPRPVAQSLYNELIAPIAPVLKQERVHTLLVSLDKNMAGIPLSALSPDGKTYLAEKLAIVSFTPGSRTQRYTALPQRPGRMLAAGVAKKMPDTDELKNVRKEIKELVGVHGSVGIFSGVALLDDAFTLPALKNRLSKGNYSLVHLATHFVFTGEDVTSFLLTGEGKTSLDKIKNLSDRIFSTVDLLTLSACQTGVPSEGKATSAEVENFAELAQRKGAAAVLASLWSVDDSSTAEWMKVFYSTFRTTGKANALRKAQQSLIQGLAPAKTTSRKTASRRVRDVASVRPEGIEGRVIELVDGAPAFNNSKALFSHPYYWAPFVLFGNPR